MKRTLLGAWAAAAFLGAAVSQMQHEARAIEPPSRPPETKYDSRQQRRAEEKRARKRARQMAGRRS